MPSATAALATGAVATAGNPAVGSRGKFLQFPRFKIRVIHPVDGSVVIDPLPHPNMVEFEDILPQSGMAGTSAIPACTILLYHPLTDEYAWAKALYDKLDQMQRIELYMIEDDDVGVVGDPCFSGVIMNLPKSETDFRIEAKDSLVLLELSRTLQSDTFNGTTDALVRYALGTYQMANTADFNTDGSWKLSAYTNDGTWTTATDQSWASIKTGLTGDGLLYSTTSYANSKYADCFIEAPFHVAANTTAGALAEAGVIAAVTDSSNLILGRALLRQVAAAQYVVDAEIWQKSAGVYGLKSQAQGIVLETNPYALVTVTLVGYQINPTQYRWTLLINEIDSNCTWTQSLASGSPSGAIGVRSVTAASCYAQHHLVFMSKSAAFQPGNIAAGAQTVRQPIPSQQNIDLLMLAMSTENGVWRKRPKAGLNNDVIDFATSVGGDLSGIVRFEGDCLAGLQTEANAEPVNSGIIAVGLKGYNHVGLHKWWDIPTIKNRGTTVGSAHLSQTADLFALRNMAQNVLLRRKQPTQATRMTVVRVAEHAELPNQPKPTGMAYRAGDWVQINDPKQGIYYSRKQLMSVRIRSGNPLMECTLEQYPVMLDTWPLVDRQKQTVDAARFGRDDYSIKHPTTGIAHDQRLVLPIQPYRLRVYLGSAENFPASTDTLVNFDTVSHDPKNGFSTTAHTYTIPDGGTGTWLSQATIAYNVPSVPNANQEYQVWIYVNGVVVSKGPMAVFSQGSIGAASPTSAFVTDELDVVSGDVVALHIVAGGTGGTAPAITGSPETYWSMRLDNR